MPRCPRPKAVLVATATLALVATSVPAVAAPATRYQMPFPCGQTWTGSTRAGHSPSTKAVDWNRSDDAGDPVVAAAPGLVWTAQTTVSGGYGRYVVLDHGNGERTLYAHLSAVSVVPGQMVDQGAELGAVGATGNARGAHLHFEEQSGSKVVRAWFDGARFEWGTLTSRNCVDVPLAGNFSGDAAAEVAVYRRGRRGRIIVDDPNRTGRGVRIGRAGDQPVVGDWDGDGYVDPGVRRPKRSKFKLRTPGGTVALVYGLPSDVPVAGDWNGDGPAEVGIRRASNASFYLRGADGSTTVVPLGDADDLPVTGDWNGDRVSDLGVYDQATATFTLRVVGATGVVSISQVVVGEPGDLPVAGDWDGNGVTDLGAWNPATATFVQGWAASPTAPRFTWRSVQFGRRRR